MRPGRSRALPSSPAAGADQLHPGQPLDALVAVHLRDHDSRRRAVRARERLPVELVCEQHVVEPRLLERQRVVVRLLERDESNRMCRWERLDEIEQIAEAHTGPVHVLNGPAGHAMKRRDLFDPWQREQLGMGEAARTLHQAADLEPPDARVEDRHRSGDRVDPPASHWQNVCSELRELRRHRREHAARPPAPRERRQPARRQQQERTTPVRAQIRVGLAHTASIVDRKSASSYVIAAPTVLGTGGGVSPRRRERERPRPLPPGRRRV